MALVVILLGGRLAPVDLAAYSLGDRSHRLWLRRPQHRFENLQFPDAIGGEMEDGVSAAARDRFGDRVAVGDKRLQRYGTQMACVDGKRGAKIGLEDPERVDERRKQMGMGPWKDYVASFGPCT